AVRLYLDKAAVILGFALLAIPAFHAILDKTLTFRIGEAVISCMMLLVTSVFILDNFLLAENSVSDHFILLSAAMSSGIVFISTREFVLGQVALSFFGRFVRPGLRSLLNSIG